MMYLLGVLCMVGLTVALPVLPDPPKLSHSIASAHQNQKFHTDIPKEETASSPARNNNHEVKKNIVKTHKVSIPPPPKLPAFDYSTLIKQKPQKARFDDAVQPEVERSVAVKHIKSGEKPVEIVKKEFKPIEGHKFQEIHPKKESKSLEEPKSVEEPKSAEELTPIEELTDEEEPKSIEEPIPKKEVVLAKFTPKLSHSIASAHQNQKFHKNTPKVETASSPVRNNNHEVKKNIVKTHKVSIPPPPKLPAFDYSTLIKQKPQEARFDDAVQPEVERSVAVKHIKSSGKPVEIVKKKFKPIESYKFQESKSLEEPKSVEEPKSAEELTPTEELTDEEESKSIEEPIPKNESTNVEEPTSVEEPKPLPVPIKEYVDEPQSEEEPKTAEEPEAEQHLDSSKLEPKEEPEKSMEDIPVQIQFTIPITTFLSNIFSKLPSLSSFGLSWPLHKPSIIGRPHLIHPKHNINEEIFNEDY